MAQRSRTWTVRTTELDLSHCPLFSSDVTVGLTCKMKKIIMPSSKIVVKVKGD